MNTSTVLETTGREPVVSPRVVARFATLADPTRLAVLEVVSDGPRCVCEIKEAVPVAVTVLGMLGRRRGAR